MLTAIEYEGFWPRIKSLLGDKESVFYEYHIAHDKRACALGKVLADKHRTTHADILGRALIGALPVDAKDRSRALEAVLEVTIEARNIKTKFYRQFAAKGVG